MGVFFLIITIGFIFTILLLLIAVRIKFVLNTDNPDMSMTFLWLSPLIKVLVTVENTKPVLSLFLFNKFIFKKAFKKSNNNDKGIKLIQLTSPKDIHVDVQYGFTDPFATGIACGAINIASQLIHIDSIHHSPNFIAENDYIFLDATAKVQLGTTLLNFLRNK